MNMRCLAARVNYKTLIIICALFTLVTVLLWNRCSSDGSGPFPRSPAGPERRAAAASNGPARDVGKQSEEASPQEQQKAPPVVGGFNKAPGLKYEEIDCLINDEHTIKGRREGSEVFLPFSWVEKYFEVYGKIAQYDGYDRFEFSHSYSKVYTQRAPYHPDGVFMSFEGYNVEVRDRVKCISGVEGLCSTFSFSVEMLLEICCCRLRCRALPMLSQQRGSKCTGDGETRCSLQHRTDFCCPSFLWHWFCWLQPSPGAGMECSSAVLLSGVDTAIATCCAKFSITQANKAANPRGWPCFPRRLCYFMGTRAAAGCISLSPAAHCLGFCLYAPGALTISPFLA